MWKTLAVNLMIADPMHKGQRGPFGIGLIGRVGLVDRVGDYANASLT
jgi:hypothetical protein